jgi:hypothetical protein
MAGKCIFILLAIAVLAHTAFASRLLLDNNNNGNDNGNNGNDNGNNGNDNGGSVDWSWGGDEDSDWSWDGSQWVQKVVTVTQCIGNANLCLASISCNNICWADLVSANNYYELCQVPCMMKYATNDIATCVKNQQNLGITDVVAQYTSVMLYCSMHPSIATPAPTPTPTPTVPATPAPPPMSAGCGGTQTFSYSNRASLDTTVAKTAGCSASNIFLVLHAKLTTNFAAADNGKTICFTSTISSTPGGISPAANDLCIVLKSGASPSSTGSPGTVTVDATKAKGTLIGFATFRCGAMCPSASSITWKLTSRSTAPINLSGDQWQFSGAAYQVDSVDTSSIMVYQNPSANCEGYPTTQTNCLVQGPFGGGGSNYCGGNSGTGSFSTC